MNSLLVEGALEIQTKPGDLKTGNSFKLVPGYCSSTWASLLVAVFSEEEEAAGKEWLVASGNYAGCPSGGRFHQIILPLCDVQSLQKSIGGQTESIEISDLPRKELTGQSPEVLFASSLFKG